MNGMVVAAAFSRGGVSTSTSTWTTRRGERHGCGGLGEAETGGPSINIVPAIREQHVPGLGIRERLGRELPLRQCHRRVARHRNRTRSRDHQAVGRQQPRSAVPSNAIGCRSIVTARNYSDTRGVENVDANAVAGDATDGLVANDDVVSHRGRLALHLLRWADVADHWSAEGLVLVSVRAEVRQLGGAREHLPMRAAGRDRGWVALGERGVSSAASHRKPTPGRWNSYQDDTGHLVDATVEPVALRRSFSRLAYIPVSATAARYCLEPDPGDRTGQHIRIVANWTYRGISTYSDPVAATTTGEPRSLRHRHQRREARYQGGSYLSDTARSTTTRCSVTGSTTRSRTPATFKLRHRSGQSHDDAPMYVQDPWTKARLTPASALRYDRASSSSPGRAQPGARSDDLRPAADHVRADEGVTGYHDLTPRINAPCDLFRNGRTAIKVNASKFLDPATNDGIFDDNDPASASMALSTAPQHLP